jgi:hypothetical protein
VKRYFLVPIHSTPLILAVAFALGLRFAVAAGLTGLFMGLLLFSWFFKYCFILFDSIVAGEDEPPVLSIEMVNPVSEQRPLMLAALVGLEFWIVSRAGIVAVIAVALILPAHVAALGYTRNVFKAVWPPTLYALISRLGWDYLLIIGVLLLGGFAAYWAAADVSLLAMLLLVQLALLLMFALVAGAMFEHRWELGIDSKTRQERLAERAQREHEIERARMLDIVHAKFRVRQPAEGWDEIERWLRTHSDLSEHRAVLTATSAWDEVRPADKLANNLVTTLLARRETGEALLIVEQRLATNPRFQVTPEAVAVRIAELAGAAGKKALQRRIGPGTER